MKKNKIFKALGVGALATLGLFTFTGCSLSDSEKAKLMNELDNATEYMEETIDQLKEQNKKLKEQNQTAKLELEESKKENDILQNYLEEIQNENAKITAEEAYNKLVQAQYDLITNKNGIRNNLRITTEQDADESNAQNYFYQTENNGYVYIADYILGNVEDFHRLDVNYESDNKVYYYRKDFNNLSDYIKIECENYDSSETALELLYLLEHLFFVPLNSLSASDIVSVQILENGNYKISALYSEVKDGESFEQYFTSIEYELSSDGLLVGVNGSVYEQKSSQDETISKCYTAKGKFEYNTVEKEYIDTILQEAIGKDLKSN